MAATVIMLSGKIWSHAPNGWLAVMIRLPLSYRCAINSNSTWVSASVFSHNQCHQWWSPDTYPACSSRSSDPVRAWFVELLYQANGWKQFAAYALLNQPVTQCIGYVCFAGATGANQQDIIGGCAQDRSWCNLAMSAWFVRLSTLLSRVLKVFPVPASFCVPSFVCRVKRSASSYSHNAAR